MVAFPKPQADRLSEMDEAPQGPPQSAQGSQPTPRWLPMTPNTVMLKSPHIFSGDHHLLTTGTPFLRTDCLLKKTYTQTTFVVGISIHFILQAKRIQVRKQKGLSACRDSEQPECMIKI